MKRSLISVLVAGGLLALAASAQANVLYSNGPAIGGGGVSVIRAGGTLFGAGAQANLTNFVADDFSVPAGGWIVEGFSFYGYQSFAGSAYTFTGGSWSIISGDVNSGTVVASGSFTPTNGGLQGYRVTGTTLSNTDRAIFQLNADVPDFNLAAGNYWLRWGMTGSLGSGPWQPPTADGAVGNATQSISGGAFNQLIDAGDGLGVELPFVIMGQVPEPASIALMIAGGLAVVGVARRRRVAA